MRSIHCVLALSACVMLCDAAVGQLPKTERIRRRRTPAVEVLLNTRNIQELIEKGEITEIKEAMEKSMSPGSQTFEQDLFRLVRQQKISTDEALANADSATNLGLLLGNSGIMPVQSQKTKDGMPKQPNTSGATSFGDFKIEEPEEKLG